jgi:hypothetical protein
LPDADFQPDLSFLHLSDIHFRKGKSGDSHDADADLRNELEIDLRRLTATRVTKIDGIIISGDIAFGGLTEEYDLAKGWIAKIAELAGCPKSGIMVTPGNHDVDWGAIPTDGDVQKLHDAIRAARTLEARDEVIADTLRDSAKGAQLLQPMEAYLAFANEYECDVLPAQPWWEKNFGLGNRGTLKIRGLTSTLISGPKDDATNFKMAYGGSQRTLMRPGDPNVFRMVVGHHPASWTLEGDDLDRAFEARAAIQLFGHKHDDWYRKGRGIRIIAGAVHPERGRPGWDPRYSALSVRLDDAGNLLTRVYPRRWSKEETTFTPDINSNWQDYRDHTIAAAPVG